jgi:hypothetical protein
METSHFATMLNSVVWILILSVMGCDGLLRGPSRLLSTETISTAQCPNIRRQSFPARLDLYYYYRIEYYSSNTLLNLQAFDRAIGAAIIDVFKDCDEQEQPMYAVQISPNGHELAEEEGTSL